MARMSKIGRLFRIETRFEAWLVIYAIALGAVERGQHYMAQYPGASGWILAAACTGVVFVAGAKLLDSVPGLMLRRSAARRLAVVDPQLASGTPVQSHDGGIAQVHALPHDSLAVGQLRLEIERAILIAELDGAAPAGVRD